MANLSPGAVAALIAIAVVIVSLYIIWKLVLLWAQRAYRHMVAKNTVSVDTFVQSKPSARSCLKCVLLNKFNVRSMVPKYDGLDLTAYKSVKVDGLMVTKRADSGDEKLKLEESKPPLVVGTIR